MAIMWEPDQQQLDNAAARIGRIFNLPDAGTKVRRDGLRLESFPEGTVTLTVELVTIISEKEANAIINGVPLDDTPEEE